MARWAVAGAALMLISIGDAQAQTVQQGWTNCSRTMPASKFFDPNQSDVMFVAFGDPQYNYGQLNANPALIEAINKANLLQWPVITAPGGTTIASVPFKNIRGVIVAGDLTQDRTVAQWNDFTREYGLCANKLVRYPVYEGYGNHDLVDSATTSGKWEPDSTTAGQAAVADNVAIRNTRRPLLLRSAGGSKGHYSWQWGTITFIQLNLAPVAWARDALGFLKSELNRVGTRPVVIVTHYGFGTWQHEPTTTEQNAYDAVIRGHNVIAHIHGHSHATSADVWHAPTPVPGSYPVPIFNVGSPLYNPADGGTTYHGTGDSYVHFTAFRITKTHVIACDVRADPNARVPAFNPGGWCRAHPYRQSR